MAGIKRVFYGFLPFIVTLLTVSCGKQNGTAAPGAVENQTAASGAEKQEEALYTIIKSDGEPDWNQIPVFPIDQVLWEPDTGIRAEGQLCHDTDNLYVHLRAQEKDIRAENTEPMSPVYEDSCLEFFFQREQDRNYFNFEINPNGCLNVQIGPEKGDRISLVRVDAADYFDIRADYTEDGWEVFYRIPLKFLQTFYQDFDFSGDLMANAYKCGNKTVHKHYIAWQPVLSEKPNFHRPEYFGRMHFE